MKKVTKMAVFLSIICLATFTPTFTVFAASNNFTNASIPEAVADENSPNLELKHKIYIENFADGVVSVVNSQGEHTIIGKVYRPATLAKESSDGFWAAHYDKASDGTFSCITAIGVNALHLKVGPRASYDVLNPTAWKPKQISVGINEDYIYAGGSYSNSMIYTSVPGGVNIFGGSTAPYVGNPVKYLNSSGTWESLDNYYNGDYSKAVPKRLLIEVYQPITANGTLDYIEFENWAAGDTVAGVTKINNGRVMAKYSNGTIKHIADIIQRVQGTGRFGGSEYAEVGRLRAAHPGVICFSTSPKIGFTNNANLRGGFQFVPANHAKYLNYNLSQDSFIGRDQWGIIAHIGADPSQLYDPNYIINGQITYDPVWEGVAPLFAEYLAPRHIPGSVSTSTYFVVSNDFGNTWNDCPSIQGVTNADNSPVASWTNIRLYVKYPN
ncbi:hypothetical protein TSYNTROOL_12980 [Tepidanaerobacter syntrophicus]|uniref:hypothetical protein n=1 Tax=Tepidanaerobacter syntrophicus TaxID=224999 RepID=UPI001764A33C|nr:hypothetical protein [Tepidanaerobacter syntrophicus]GLI51212.1 hypothetical protein TSYNTROOL_12980 [Tepidanaerobacter syntrophicus]HHV82052.1 hypothetical protein [Tepidanaerobacter syntrophicus]